MRICHTKVPTGPIVRPSQNMRICRPSKSGPLQNVRIRTCSAPRNPAQATHRARSSNLACPVRTVPRAPHAETALACTPARLHTPSAPAVHLHQPDITSHRICSHRPFARHPALWDERNARQTSIAVANARPPPAPGAQSSARPPTPLRRRRCIDPAARRRLRPRPVLAPVLIAEMVDARWWLSTDGT